MLALVVMCLSFAAVNLLNDAITGAIISVLAAIPCAAFGILWLKPLRGTIQKVRAWEVSIPRGDYACTVSLYGSTPGAGPLMSFELTQNVRSKTFTNLTFAVTYFIEIAGMDGNVVVTVTD